MYTDERFRDLERACREKAALAEKEMLYWLAEADDWARRITPDLFIERIVTRERSRLEGDAPFTFIAERESGAP